MCGVCNTYNKDLFLKRILKQLIPPSPPPPQVIWQHVSLYGQLWRLCKSIISSYMYHSSSLWFIVFKYCCPFVGSETKLIGLNDLCKVTWLHVAKDSLRNLGLCLLVQCLPTMPLYSSWQAWRTVTEFTTVPSTKLWRVMKPPPQRCSLCDHYRSTEPS